MLKCFSDLELIATALHVFVEAFVCDSFHLSSLSRVVAWYGYIVSPAYLSVKSDLRKGAKKYADSVKNQHKSLF